MRNWLLIIFSMWFVTLSIAQDPNLKVVATAGNSYTSSSVQLDWTLGEVMIATIENSTTIISQGMHQPMYNITSTKIIPADIGAIQLFPNPTSDFVDIRVGLIKSSDLEIEMTNTSGQLILKKKYIGDKIMDRYFFKDLPQGTYLITIIVVDLSASQTFKIIKTN
ncbi:MAG: T9SS type A sorting domain-containing protein [Saprospiraceae bacterium]|uniref:T9SS type A sorting domain-containing protein n=1 Tax=Candidatus Opimibacter skivensis TaxID=2982028 RepID=A0A9D7SVD6_9BACT|nr:T9SS type A sorting domain-containing protein [Candidatus Opimibacter skivensis]